MKEDLDALLARLSRDAPLAPWTTWGIGGPAEYLFEPADEPELVDAVRLATSRGIPVTLLGRGSNVLVDDAGVPGLVVLLARSLTDLVADPDTGRIRASAGAPLPKIASRATQSGIAALTFLIGIPGTLGGGIVMNAGIGGRDGTAIDGVLTSARVFDPAGDEVWDIDAASAGLRYRGSAIADRGLIVLAAELQGRPGADPAELGRESRALRARRAARQPLHRRTSGSVFTQPAGHPPAGELIDRAGLKGCRIGNAAISVTHANWIENLGGATADDVRRLMEHVERVVLERYGVRLRREVRELPPREAA